MKIYKQIEFEEFNHIIHFIYDKKTLQLKCKRHRTIFCNDGSSDYLFFQNGVVDFYPDAQYYNSLIDLDYKLFLFIIQRLLKGGFMERNYLSLGANLIVSAEYKRYKRKF